MEFISRSREYIIIILKILLILVKLKIKNEKLNQNNTILNIIRFVEYTTILYK